MKTTLLLLITIVVILTLIFIQNTGVRKNNAEINNLLNSFDVHIQSYYKCLNSGDQFGVQSNLDLMNYDLKMERKLIGN